MSLADLAQPEMSEAALEKICDEQGLYLRHELNDRLYLQNRGYKKIEGLSGYQGLKGIWFDSNAIHTIENLSHLRGLKFLYLRQNCIRELGGLDELYHLEVLDVSANFISKIENLDNLRSLNTLLISRNKLKSCADIAHLVQLPRMATLDLSFNKLVTPAEDDPYKIVEILECVPQLKSLDLRGNPVAEDMNQYRSVFATRMGGVFEVLDGEPMSVEERKVAKESTKLQFWLEQKTWQNTMPEMKCLSGPGPSRDCCSFHASLPQ